MEEERVTSIGGIVALVARQAAEWKATWEDAAEWVPWFRGEPEADSPTALRPKLYRHPAVSLEDSLYLEQELRLEFRRQGVQLAEERPPDSSDKWGWYVLMQHYGVPTRLLDWSDGALVALHFAVAERSTKDAAVYMLDPQWLNGRSFPRSSGMEGVALTDWDEARRYVSEDETDNERLRPRFPLAVDPLHVSRRLATQRSRLTVFGKERDGLKLLATRRGSRLLRIRIREAAIDGIKSELRLAGVSESAIFPDLEGLGRELRAWWDKTITAGKRKTGGQRRR